MLKSVLNRRLEPEMMIALPFNKTATITKVEVGRKFVTLEYISSVDNERYMTRVMVDDETMIIVPDPQDEYETVLTPVVILNDGETYSDLEGCKILHIPEGMGISGEDLNRYVKDNYRFGTPITIKQGE